MIATYKQIDNEVFMPKVLSWELREKIKGINIEAGYNTVIAKIEYEMYSDELITVEQQVVIDLYIEGLYEVVDELKAAREKQAGQVLFSCRVHCKTDDARKVRDEYIHPALDRAGFDRIKSGDTYCHAVLSSEKEKAHSIIEALQNEQQAELTWIFAEII